jgi:hypothetical protein
MNSRNNPLSGERRYDLPVTVRPEPVEGLWLRSWWFNKLGANGLMKKSGLSIHDNTQ